MVRCAVLARSTSFAHELEKPRPGWRTYSLRSPEIAASHRGHLQPLLLKELREVLSGRALWTMLLLLCPLVGYSFLQAVDLYSEASTSARDSPVSAWRGSRDCSNGFRGYRSHRRCGHLSRD